MAAAKGGFAVFDKVSGKMEYVKRTFDDDEELRDRMR